ncbi:ferritin heavy chain [Cimex lectularius]|uniref:Ferritin n=1 Tax=Cimex lectularius TaxID=79782 RepID=A0A8I6RZ39_CIMLE|nr:ferritin heavy chain [Cimex lectularius]XP_014255154.1 ferritin heavy chain [Cimex lectularius]
MKNLSLILPLAFIGLVYGEYCYDSTVASCMTQSSVKTNLPSCDSKYSGVHHIFPDLEDLFRTHIDFSYQYLLMSTNFANHEKNRDGFSKLYRKLSDSAWEDAMDLAKYVAKRGGSFSFTNFGRTAKDLQSVNYELYELESLARALDMSKHLAEKVHKVHGGVTNRNKDYHDAEAISFLENKFVHKHADSVREISGYTNDLTKLVKNSQMGNSASLSVFLFDEYLQKAL